MPSAFKSVNLRQHQESQTGRLLIIYSVVAPLGALALPWSSITNDALAKKVERLQVGSATELVWGFQYPLAYLFLMLWLVPIAFVLSGAGTAKAVLPVSFLPLLLLVITGSVFGTNLGPLLCLGGALTLPCGVIKFQKPEGSTFSAFSSMLRRTKPPSEEDENTEEDFAAAGEVEPDAQTDSGETRESSVAATSPMPSNESKAVEQTAAKAHSTKQSSTAGLSIPGYSPPAASVDSTEQVEQLPEEEQDEPKAPPPSAEDEDEPVAQDDSSQKSFLTPGFSIPGYSPPAASVDSTEQVEQLPEEEQDEPKTPPPSAEDG